MKAYLTLCAAILVAGSSDARAQTQEFPIDGGNSTVACRVDGNIQRTGRPFGSYPTTVTGCTLAADTPVLLTGPGMSVYCKAGGLVQFFPEIARLKSCVVNLDANLRDTANAPVVCRAGFTAEFNERGYLLACRSAAVAGGGSSGGGLFRPLPPPPPSTPPPPVDRGTPGGGGLFGGVLSQPPAASGVQDWSTVCRSAMTAILRGHQASYGPQASVRIEWVRPFSYDNGDCVGGFKLWVRRPGDVSEWVPLEWNADTGTGRVPVSGLVQQYAKDNPDLPWTPASGQPVPRAQAGVPDYAPICQSAMKAIERHFARLYGPEFVRIEWIRPFTFDKGDCVGGYKLWARRLSDQKEWAPLEWNADTGAGRVSVQGLVQQYSKDNPDLQWTPSPAVSPPATSGPRAVPPAVTGGASNVIPYPIDTGPFAVEIPGAWTGRKTEAGTIVFEGQQGTEAYQATVELQIGPHADFPGKSLDDMVQTVGRALGRNANAHVDPPQARGDGTRQAAAIRATYTVQGNQGMVPVRHLSVLVDYPNHFVVLSYFAPDSLFDKYLPMYQQIGDSFRYTGRE